MVDYKVEEDGDLVNIKVKGSIERINVLPFFDIARAFVDEFEHNDYGLGFTEDPPSRISEELSGEDEAVYISVSENPENIMSYVYFFGSYFDIPTLELTEVADKLQDSSDYDRFLDVMSSDLSIDRSNISEVVDESFTGFSSEEITSDKSDSAFE